MRIIADNTLAIIVDIQERLFPHIYDHEKLLDNCNKIILGLNILNIPMLITEQYTKGLGSTMTSIKENMGLSYLPIEKIYFSCLGSVEFFDKLKSMNKKNIILIGIEAHVCVLQTALDLLENSYQPVIIEDCVSSRFINNKNIAIERMRSEGAIISTYESILFELCKAAGTDTFKNISKLVK